VSPTASERGRATSRHCAHLGLDGVSESIAVGVLAHEAGVDDVQGLCGKSRDAARRADRCSLDLGVIALGHARHHPRSSAVSMNLPMGARMSQYAGSATHIPGKRATGGKTSWMDLVEVIERLADRPEAQ
jgi:hypothetical protein